MTQHHAQVVDVDALIRSAGSELERVIQRVSDLQALGHRELAARDPFPEWLTANRFRHEVDLARLRRSFCIGLAESQPTRVVTLIEGDAGDVSAYFRDFHRPRTLGGKPIARRPSDGETVITKDTNPALFAELKDYTEWLGAA